MSAVAQCAPTSIVNMDYLRSGFEFSSSTAHKKTQNEDKTAVVVNGPKKDRNTRLAEFYTTMLKPHITPSTTGARIQSTVDSSAADMNAWDGLSMGTSKDTPQSMVNLDFLRSGKEFLKSQKNTNEVKDIQVRNRNLRLDKFYEKTLYPHEQNWKETACELDEAREAKDNNETLDCWDGMQYAKPTKSPADTPSIVNMDFLRSGGEFNTADSRPPITTKERKKGKNARLEEFYEHTLSAFST